MVPVNAYSEMSTTIRSDRIREKEGNLEQNILLELFKHTKLKPIQSLRLS